MTTCKDCRFWDWPNPYETIQPWHQNRAGRWSECTRARTNVEDTVNTDASMMAVCLGEDVEGELLTEANFGCTEFLPRAQLQPEEQKDMPTEIECSGGPWNGVKLPSDMVMPLRVEFDNSGRYIRKAGAYVWEDWQQPLTPEFHWKKD